MFKVGQKVVCIKPVDDLVMGGIYTVETVTEFLGHIGVVSVEHKAFSISGGYYAYRFRPLDESFADEVLERIKEEIMEEELCGV